MARHSNHNAKLEAQQFGLMAEELAVKFLQAQGMAIRTRNWRAGGRGHEIDIIAQQGTAIVFVEVKGRTTPGTDPLEAVTPAKMRAVARAADSYLRALPQPFSYRFDIVAVTCLNPPQITHIPDAFLAPLFPA